MITQKLKYCLVAALLTISTASVSQELVELTDQEQEEVIEEESDYSFDFESVYGRKGEFEISIGWGDQIFESLVWHSKAEPFGLLPESYIINSNQNYSYSQHWYLQVQYRPKKWFSYGGMVDFSKVSWDNKDYNGKGEMVQDNGRQHFSNFILMPSVTFHYMHKPHVQLHSGLAAGFDINTGNQKDYRGRYTVLAPAFYINPIGVRGSIGCFFGNIDLGALFALRNTSELFLVGSRLYNVSVGVKF